ncbi:MAG: sensor histidine kinase, partial [Sphingobacterium sp.]
TRAWHKLLRVLTHEIMNSIAPISSLAETLHERLEHWEAEKDIEDLKVGIFTIRRRSEGLLQFAKSYRLINKVDQPQLSEILVVQLFENIYKLLEPNLIQKNIDVDILIKNTRLVLLADINLLEQILINLLLNAIEAVKEVKSPYISLSAIDGKDHIQLKIQDNGVGMSTEIQEQIFTPFFTTKKTGTGVGLTLSKQIMLLHGGNIFVDSQEGTGSLFTLQF